MNTLRQFLDERGMKTSFLSHKIGISRASLYNLLNGDTTPTLEVALSIEKVTGGIVRCEDWLRQKPKDEKKKRGKVNENHNTDEPEFDIIEKGLV